MTLPIKEIQELGEKFPLLEYTEKSNILSGCIEIDGDDKYYLQIDISFFPNQFPTVIETDERIPRKIDRHVYPDKTLCLTTTIIERLLLQTSVKSLQNFFELILVPYLLNNSYYEINKTYRFGEYSHCLIESTYESYQDILGIDNKKELLPLLLNVFFNKKYRPNDKCFCGSGIKIKNCGRHEAQLKKFKSVNKKTPFIDITDVFLINISDVAFTHIEKFVQSLEKLGNRDFLHQHFQQNFLKNSNCLPITPN